MGLLKEWGLLLLFVCAGSLIYCFLVPSGNISKTVKSVISVIVLSSVCLPLTEITGKGELLPDFEDDFPDIPDMSDDYIKSAKLMTERIISDTVKKFTNVPFESDIIIDKNEDGSINIGYIGIVFSAVPGKQKELRGALYEALGVMPDIRVEKNGG